MDLYIKKHLIRKLLNVTLTKLIPNKYLQARFRIKDFSPLPLRWKIAQLNSTL